MEEELHVVPQGKPLACKPCTHPCALNPSWDSARNPVVSQCILYNILTTISLKQINIKQQWAVKNCFTLTWQLLHSYSIHPNLVTSRRTNYILMSCREVKAWLGYPMDYLILIH